MDEHYKGNSTTDCKYCNPISKKKKGKKKKEERVVASKHDSMDG